MTAAEMKASFLVQYDAAMSLTSPGWEDSEISSFLNLAQDRLVEELYKVKDFQSMSTIVRTVKDLSLSAHPSISNGTYVKIDTLLPNWLYYVSSRTFLLSRTNPIIENEWVYNEIVDITIAPKFFRTSMNNVWFKQPKVFFENIFTTESQGHNMVILYDAYTTAPTSCELVYVKYPVRIFIDNTTPINCDLNLLLHNKIVEYAVAEALKSVKLAKLTTQS